MKYIVDTANRTHIEEVLSMGIDGVTANPSMYMKNNENFYSFLQYYSDKNLGFLSGEVMGDTLEEMLEEVEKIQNISKDIVIKINFSPLGLKLCSILSKRNIKTAMTLLFTVSQAMAAIQAGADYLFPFVGRNEENGTDGLEFVCALQDIVTQKEYDTKVVAASVKNLYQLEFLAKNGVDYAAVTYELYMKSLNHVLTTNGEKQFKEDWAKLTQTN